VRYRSIFAIVSFLGLAACQEERPILSLEQARQVTSNFEGQSFVPPPRTIRDITAILDDPAMALPKAKERPIPKNRVGNYLKDIDRLTRHLRTKPGDLPAYRSLVVKYVRVGDLKGAQRTKRTFLNVFNGLQNQYPWPTIIKAHIEWTMLTAEGRFVEAEPFHRREIEILLDSGEAERKPWVLDNAFQELARNLRRQGRLMEAEALARDALISALRRVGKFSLSGVYLTRELGAALYAQGRYQEAEALVRASIEIAEQIGLWRGDISLMLARRILSEILVAREDWPSAIQQFERIRKDASPFMTERLTTMSVGLPLALLKSGHVEKSREFLATAFRRDMKRLGPKHYRTAEKGGVLAMAHAVSGNKKRALKLFADAVPILLSSSRQSDTEESSQAVTAQRLGLILESHIKLLAKVHGTSLEKELKIDAVAEAFRIADIARSRSVQGALSASGARAATGNVELAVLVRSEQDTRKQISALFGLLANVLSAPSDQQDLAATKALRTRIDDLRNARSALIEEIEKRFPDYAALINPKPATVDGARQVLQAGEALISTYVAKDMTYVWAVPKSGPVAFATVPLGKEALLARVAVLREALEPNASTLGDIPVFDVASAHDLYTKILRPLEASWKDAKSLLVVAHGPLGYLPLSVLPTESVKLAAEKGALFSNYRDIPWLVRSHAVTVLPAVASLLGLRSLPPGAAGRRAFAGFGDPLFSSSQAREALGKPIEVAALSSRGLRTRGLPIRLRAAPKTAKMDSAGLAQLPRLPDTADEVRSIALALSADMSRDVYLGKNASEGAVKGADLSNTKVLVFATHGLVPGDLNGLTQPALALSSPYVAGDTNNDGLLTMGEILALKLNADWVVLSACNTGSGEGAGAEAASGLGRAFFYAGTRALLVSNWPVETTSAKGLTTDLFQRQAKDSTLTRAAALRQTMISMIDGDGYVDPASGKTVFSYAHPIFWAPFSLVGDGGGVRVVK